MASTGDTWRLGHRPALDGLRGIAVLLVLAEHTGALWWTHAPGAVGVAMFFTLSGFLITSLLLDEIAATGRISLPRFFARRAGRLVPAMLACVALAVAVEYIRFREITDWNLITGTLTYTANFVMMDEASWPSHSALGHTWSLSIEEQFYLAWPLVFLLLRRLPIRRLTAVFVAGFAASLVLRVVLIAHGASVWRLYFGPDARVDELLAGCALAFGLHFWPTRVSRLWKWVGAMILVVASVTNAGVGFNFILAPSITAIAMVFLLAVAAMDRMPWLEWRPLQVVGVRSYGIYLYQAPMGLLLRGAPPLLAVPMILLGTWLLAALSHQFLEQPVRAAVARRFPHAGRPIRRPSVPRTATVGLIARTP